MTVEPTIGVMPELPDVAMNLVRPTDPVIGTVVENQLCMKSKSASFVRHVAIDVSDTPLAGAFLPGQSFGIIPPGDEPDGKKSKVRLYSLACPSWGEDGQSRVISTTPKRLIEELRPHGVDRPNDDHRIHLGRGSNYLCDLAVGDRVQLTGPSGKRFLLPRDTEAHDYLFIATGTGIAPFRGMLMELFQRSEGPTERDVHLLMGAPYTSDLLYHDFLTDLETAHPNFHYHTAISREARPDGRRGLYVDKLLDEELDRFRPLLESPRTLVYLCGIIGMQVGVFTTLALHDLHHGYVTLKGDLGETHPTAWPAEDVKRHARPTARCMVEVY